MYYHIILETNDLGKKKDEFKKYYEFDKLDTTEVISDIVLPYLQKHEFQFDGYFIKPENVKRISIRTSNMRAYQLADDANAKTPPNVFIFLSKEDIIDGDRYTIDATKEVFAHAKEMLSEEPKAETKVKDNFDMANIFIVHGHDDLAKTQVARFVEKLGLKAIILHEQASSSKTIIEKIEAFSNVGYAIVLYTPCDIGKKDHDDHELKSRARQNVVFEHGYFIGHLGRSKVTALVKGKIETPNDISGVVYTDMDERGAWMLDLAKELKEAGYTIDLENAL